MPEGTTTLTCPKCAGEMRTYERNGVHIDQCAECRGIFLDRGELDRLINAESTFYESPQRPPAPPEYAQPHYGGDRDYEDKHYGDKHYGDKHYGHKRKRRGGFLEELFD